MKPTICKHSILSDDTVWMRKYYVCTKMFSFYCPTNGKECDKFEFDLVKMMKKVLKEKNNVENVV